MYVCFAILATISAILRPTLAEHFSRQWVLHVPGGRAVADAVAADHGFENLGEMFEDYYHVSHPRIVRRSVNPHPGKRAQLAVDTRVSWAQQQRVRRRSKRDYRMEFSDIRWNNMWYLNRGVGLDMNVIPAWQEGITGKGAVVTILDDGLEKDHPDLLQNYDPLASYDVNNQDTDPSPRYDMIDSNRHGTRCAGEVAATANNSICSLGVAHGAQVGGVRMLDGDVTDAVEARSLSLNPQHIDIYSASWGPDDDGKTVDGPGEFATRAFVEGVSKGRDGKGSIFVWASGNGGRDHDNCNCDGYTNSIYSLSISSATEHGRVPWYSEACSSTLATTYSSGEVGERQVVTTDLHHACTSSHTGTSASAPLAAGICALALEANPKLTWRDMQHIVVRTARPQNLVAHDWQTNGVGRNVSHSFGYGLMDAHAMVRLARKWITVPEQHSFEIKAPQTDKKIPARSVVVLSLTVSDAGQVKFLEHVQAKLTITSHKRGDLNIQLISPMGTRVTLLAHRIHDLSRSGFTNWPFMSVHSWGESPIGTWSLEVHNDGRLLGRATLQAWSLVLYGVNQTNPNDLDPFSQLSAKVTNKKFNAHVAGGNNGGGTSQPKERKKNKKQKAKNKAKAKPTVAVSRGKKPDLLPFYYAVNASKFSKYAKNYSITYPIMIPEREFASAAHEHRKKLQKQKEKSRDLNSNRNSDARPLVTTPVSPSTTMAAPSRNKSAQIHEWDLVFYGTTTLPVGGLNDPVQQVPKLVHSEDINENVIEEDDETKPPIPEIRKDLEEEDEFAQQAISGCKQSRGGVCIVCMESYYFFDNACVDRCPPGFYVTTYTEYNYNPSEVPAILACEPCHYSCLSCNASADYACTECFPDAFLYQRTATESYCYPQTVRTFLLEDVWCYRVFIVLIFILSLGAICVAIFLVRRMCKETKESNFMKMDSLRHIRDIERRVKSAVYSDSE